MLTRWPRCFVLYNIGGPITFTRNQIAEPCFEALDTPVWIVHLPDVLRRTPLRVLPRLAPRQVAGRAQLFLTAMAMNVTAVPFGTHHFADHFKSFAEKG